MCRSALSPSSKRFTPRDYVFCGYDSASHFPNCCVIPGKDREATAARRQAHFNSQWARIVAGLSPKFAFPFAADVVFFEHDLFWSNEPVHNSQRPITAFARDYRGAATHVLDIAPGFTLENGEIKVMKLREELRGEKLRKILAKNCDFCRDYLLEYRGDYRLLIRFRNGDRAIAVVRAGEKVSVQAVAVKGAWDCDLVYTTRLAYLKWSLTTEYGYEILFVGSGGIFEYVKAKPETHVHRELMVIVKKHETPPVSRFGDSSAAVYRVK